MKLLIVFVLVLATSILSVESGVRVFNGQLVTTEDLNFVVKLTIFTGLGSFTCSGSLIENGWVLTAAHCFENGGRETTVIRIGNIEPNTIVRDAEEVIMHEDFVHNDTHFINDIALVRFQTFQSYINFVRSIPLNVETSPIENKLAIVAGWGLTGKPKWFNDTSSALYYGYVFIKDWKTCYEELEKLILKNQFCSFPSFGSTPCVGDSGGPLFIMHSRFFKLQIGLVSYGIDRCNPRGPAVYTSISAFMPWIELKMGLSFTSSQNSRFQ